MHSQLAQGVAAEILRQHDVREGFKGLGGALTLSDAKLAYEAQDAYVDLLLQSRKTQLRGYKIALTTPAMREMVNFQDSVSGRLFADQYLRTGDSVHAGHRVHLGVEFEIAFEMGRDLPARASAWSGKELLKHVACAYPAIEIIDDRGADYTSLNRSILTLIADNAWNQGLVLGAPKRGLGADFLRDILGVAMIDGQEIGRGTGRDVLGHPLDALAWLANHLPSRGLALREGDIVTTGSLVKSQFPKAGQKIHWKLAGLGEVALDVV
jgi:2-keto-4-pentenoate hydratase